MRCIATSPRNLFFPIRDTKSVIRHIQFYILNLSQYTLWPRFHTTPSSIVLLLSIFSLNVKPIIYHFNSYVKRLGLLSPILAHISSIPTSPLYHYSSYVYCLLYILVLILPSIFSLKYMPSVYVYCLPF